MRIGIDFDNTIVCYDAVFHRLALERQLISANVPMTKQAVRDELRSNGKEQDWIELQGEVYGARMDEAIPFEGVLEFLRKCDRDGQKYFIVSHKTERPVAGQPYDLHKEAKNWLANHGLPSLNQDGVYFETIRPLKHDRIKRLGCTHFIDDLPEFLTADQFPQGVERLLFDPMEACEPDSRIFSVKSWESIDRHLLNPSRIPQLPQNPDFERIAEKLLGKIGRSAPFKIQRLMGGVNNQVFRLEVGSESYILKVYFSHPDDPRDRLGVETVFTNYARALGLTCLHKLISFDRDQNAALYTFIEGSPISTQNVDHDLISQAMRFLIALNYNRNSAKDLPIASEASFSIQGHIDKIERRVELLLMQVQDRAAHDFVETAIEPVWQIIKAEAKFAAGARYFEELSDDNRCISPSDFGFHNAILDRDNQVHFVDFEYAGWDDPAHLFCDFFSQIAVPISEKFKPDVVSSLVSIVSDPTWFRQRIEILMPIYRMKWCCILLNDFLPTEGKRREFAGLQQNENRQRSQLERAQILLDSVREHASTNAYEQAG